MCLKDEKKTGWFVNLVLYMYSSTKPDGTGRERMWSVHDGVECGWLLVFLCSF